MATSDRKCVSTTKFTALLNDELHRHPECRTDREFRDVGSGYDFIAPSLDVLANCALDKLIFDTVAAQYTIAR